MVNDLGKALLLSLMLGGMLGIAVGVRDIAQNKAAIISDLNRDALLAVDTLELLARNLRLAVTTVAANIDPDNMADSAVALWPRLRQEWIDFRTVLIIDMSGMITADLGRGGAAVGTDVSFRDYFRQIVTDPSNIYFVGAPIISQFDGQWVLPVSAPILDSDMVTRGVVTASVDYSHFDPSQWQTLGARTNVHLLAMETGGVFDLDLDNALLGPNATLDSAIVERMTQGPDDLPYSLPIPGQTAFVVQTSHEGLGVIVSRPTDEIETEAMKAGTFVGSLTGVLSALVMFVFLRGRVVLRRVRADARQLRMLQERQRLATGAGGIGIWDLDISSGTVVWDALMHKCYGTDPSTFNGTFEEWRERLHPDDVTKTVAAFQKSVQAGTDFNARFRILTPQGEERTLQSAASITLGPDGRSKHMIGVNLDITREIASEKALTDALERIEYDATHDALTSIGNRRGFFYHVDALGARYRADVPIAILLLDIDQYKMVNDVVGHTGGDHLLKVVATLLESAIGADGYVARIGGDEFAMILCGADLENRAQATSERILELCREPVPYKNTTIRYTASIGTAIGNLSSAHRLLEDADIALYEAKHSGRNQWQIYCPEMRAASQEKKHLADDLTVAIQRGEIGIRLQPQVCARSETLSGAEVLMRWWHPRRGELSPGEFLPVATELGLLTDLDRIMMQQAIQAADTLARQGIVLPSLSMNVSLERLTHPGIVADVANLPDYPGELIFELLEVTDFSCSHKDVFDRITELRELGVKFAVDDFGSGHASLTTLLTLHPDYVKIDKRLVIEGTTGTTGPSPFLVTISELCQRLKIATIAEGVETRETVDIMVGLGADILQGFFFAKPLTVEEFVSWAQMRGPQDTVAPAPGKPSTGG